MSSENWTNLEAILSACPSHYSHCSSETCHIKLKHGLEVAMTIWWVPLLWHSVNPPFWKILAKPSKQGKSGWRSGHQSRLPPLLQMLYVDWVSVDLNLTSRVSSGHFGFLPPQKLTYKNRTPFKLALLNWTFLYKYWPLILLEYFWTIISTGSPINCATNSNSLSFFLNKFVLLD